MIINKTRKVPFSENGILEVSARKKNVAPLTPTRHIPIQTHNVNQQGSKSSKRSDSTGSSTGSK